MTTQVITNEILYELIKGLESKTDKHFEQVNNRFEQMDNRFKQIDKRLEQIDNRFEQNDKRLEQNDKRLEQNDKRSDRIELKLNRIEDIARENQRTLGELWQTRKEVTINFSKAFAGANAFISGVIAVIVSLFIKRS